MKKLLLNLALLMVSVATFSGNSLISNSGYTFSPSAVTISLGDSVTFQIAGIHNAVEVSQSTWSANGTTALTGGFSVAYGGGLVLPAQLTVGTHYYVCQAHASMGMKGTITVTNGTNGIIEASAPSAEISIYPMPVKNEAEIKINANGNLQGCVFVLYDAVGLEVSRTAVPDGMQFNIQSASLANGVYVYRLMNSEQVVSTGKLVVER